MRGSKAPNEGFERRLKFFKVKCLVNVRSNVKADASRLIGCQDQARDSCKPKLCQSASEGMKKVRYMRGAQVKFRLSTGQVQAK